MRVGLISDTEIRLHRFRPPCPRCRRRTWPTHGLERTLVFYCFVHGFWIPEAAEDENGPLPLFRWRIYDWRFT